MRLQVLRLYSYSPKPKKNKAKTKEPQTTNFALIPHWSCPSSLHCNPTGLLAIPNTPRMLLPEALHFLHNVSGVPPILAANPRPYIHVSFPSDLCLNITFSVRPSLSACNMTSLPTLFPTLLFFFYHNTSSNILISLDSYVFLSISPHYYL